MWFTEAPKRWEREQESLRAAGIPYTLDEVAYQSGFIRVQLLVNEGCTIKGIPSKFLPLKLTVIYPSAYPYFRPDVYAPGLTLPRHQNLISKNLCLLPRQAGFWLPETTLGEYLAEQLPKVLTEGEIVDREILGSNIEEQGEPASEYYPGIAEAPVIIDTSSFDALPPSNRPIEYLGSLSLGFPAGAKLPGRIWALENFDHNDKSIGKLPESVAAMFPPRRMGYVYRLKARPPHGDATKDYQWILALMQQQKARSIKPKPPTALKGGGAIDNVIGLTFPEEHSAGQQGWGWLFIVAVTRQVPAVKNKKQVLRPMKDVYYAKANRINMKELGFRIESLKPLTPKTITILGIGALGGPSAIEFARNGIGELRLVDFDTVSAGTIVRWPLGAAAVGMLKTKALKIFIDENYPYTKVIPSEYQIGSVGLGETGTAPLVPSQMEFIEKVLAGTSLVYDATAETGISHFLSEEAKRRKIPFVSVYATPGVWGGAVMRVVPGETAGCWMCFQYGLQDGSIPNPPTNRDGSIQAAGCGDISFTGTSFELDNIVSAGVRLAVSTLCSTEKGYPDLNGDVGIVSLVDDHANPVFPRWSVHQLAAHPDCPYCHPNHK